MPALSIVVPARDEATNLPALVSRIDCSMSVYGISYEIIVIDDRSQDDTVEVLEKLATWFPVRLWPKSGPQGKGYSLLEGFRCVNAPVVCMIDADLQYPPESIGPMAAYVFDRQADIVVASRRALHADSIRRTASLAWRRLSRLLYGLDIDTQAGLKLIRADILRRLVLRPSAWAIDLDLLVKAHITGYRIMSHDIEFVPRQRGSSKLRIPVAVTQILVGATRLMLIRYGFPRPATYDLRLSAKAPLGVSALGSLSALAEAIGRPED